MWRMKKETMTLRTDEQGEPVRPKCAREDDHQESDRQNEREEYHSYSIVQPEEKTLKRLQAVHTLYASMPRHDIRVEGVCLS